MALTTEKQRSFFLGVWSEYCDCMSVILAQNILDEARENVQFPAHSGVDEFCTKEIMIYLSYSPVLNGVF